MEESGGSVIGYHIGLAADATCRKVQIGTEVVPVYEIRCGDNGLEIEEPTEKETATA